MVENIHEEKTARQIDRLSEALESGVKYRVGQMVRGLSAVEIGDLLESLPLTKRLAVWDIVDPDLDGEVLVDVNDEVRTSLIRDMTPDELVAAVGDLDLDDLVDILADLPDAVITKELSSTDRTVQTIPVDMSAGQVALEFEHHDLISAPVTDADQRILGTITIDDPVDVIRDEAEHSVLTMAGLDEEDDMFAPAFQPARKRWLWLAVNLVTALMAAGVLYIFEPTLQQVVATVWHGKISLGVVIAIAILLNLMAGDLAGALVPVILRRLSIDSALAGGVVRTTVTDIVGISAFVGLATFVLLAH